jgi:hypothetical protein
MTDLPASFEKPPKASEHCRHYSYERGVKWHEGGPRCAAGVDLSEPGAAMKCMPPKADQPPCALRGEYSAAERETWEASVAAGLERLGKAVQAIPHPVPMRSGGTVKCPNCRDGQLRYDRWQGGAEICCTTPLCCAAHFNLRGVKDWPASPK